MVLYIWIEKKYIDKEEDEDIVFEPIEKAKKIFNGIIVVVLVGI